MADWRRPSDRSPMDMGKPKLAHVFDHGGRLNEPPRLRSRKDQASLEDRRTSGLVQSIDAEFLIDAEGKQLSVTDDNDVLRLLLGQLATTPTYGLKIWDASGNLVLDFNDSYQVLYGDFFVFANTGMTSTIEILTGDTIRWADTGGNLAVINVYADDLILNTANYGGQDIQLLAKADIVLNPGASGYLYLGAAGGTDRVRAYSLGLNESATAPTLSGAYAEVFLDSSDNMLKVKKTTGGVVDLEEDVSVNDLGTKSSNWSLTADGSGAYVVALSASCSLTALSGNRGSELIKLRVNAGAYTLTLDGSAFEGAKLTFTGTGVIYLVDYGAAKITAFGAEW